MTDCIMDKVFSEAFGEDYVADRKHWAWPSLDSGQWARKSLLVIYHEEGLGDEWTYPHTEPKWRKLEAALGKKVFGFDVYIESINPAVSAVYPV